MPHDRSPQLYPRARLETLSDGIYAVAMTLLVLDLRLPDDLHPRSAAQLTAALLQLWPKAFPYLLSFGVLGLRWLSSVRVRTTAEFVGGAYIRLWLLNLLLVTCVPFTTIVAGRYGALAPAAWLYAGNTGLMALASLWQISLLPQRTGDGHRLARDALAVLLASSVATIVLSWFEPSDALWGFAINLFTPLLERLRRRRPVPA